VKNPVRALAALAYRRKWTARIFVLVVMPVGFAVALPFALAYALCDAWRGFAESDCWDGLSRIANDALATFKSGQPREYRRRPGRVRTL
jgi:hypothetical protein